MPNSHFTAVLLAGFVLLTGLSAQTAPEGTFTPFFTITLGDQPYISMVELAEMYRTPISYDPVTLTMTLTRGTLNVSVSNLSRTAKQNDSLIPLVYPARLIRGAMYVPVSTFLPIFSRLIHTGLTWDNARNGIISPETGYSVRGIFIEEREQGTLVRIAMTEPHSYTAELGEYNWLIITIPGGSLSPNVGISAPPSGMVLDSRFMQREQDVQLSFRISESMEKYDISRAADSFDLFVSLRKKRETVAGSKPDSPAQAIESILGVPGAKHTEPFFNEDLWRIDTVVIDPGHGGRDSGAIGPGGTREKDIVLAVAKELKRLIDERGELEGVITRESDVFISLYQRAAIAKKANGKLFVSIHANASRSRSAKGMEVFFLSAAKTEDAKSVAERENASVELEDNPMASRRMLNEKGLLSEIEKDMAANVYLSESQDMCKVLLDTTIPATRQINRGVKQAGFYVLAGTLPAMPSILFEIGFISNPEEEKMLKRISYQKRIAQSIYDAVITFKNRHERGLFTKSE